MATATLHLARLALSPSPAIAAIPWVRLRRRCVHVRCRLDGSGGGGAGSEGKGERDREEEEAPEAMFTKELRRRGMAPGSTLSEAEAEAEEGEEASGGGERRRPGVAATVESGQRERSMALNSEGLEGLIPRAKLLVSFGSTFFLGFLPLMIITISLFAVLYTYFGPSFVHDASKTPVWSPPYIDPYTLLEDERLSRPSPDVF